MKTPAKGARHDIGRLHGAVFYRAALNQELPHRLWNTLLKPDSLKLLRGLDNRLRDLEPLCKELFPIARLRLQHLVHDARKALGLRLQQRRELSAAQDFMQSMQSKLRGAQAGVCCNKVGVPQRIGC